MGSGRDITESVGRRGTGLEGVCPKVAVLSGLSARAGKARSVQVLVQIPVQVLVPPVRPTEQQGEGVVWKLARHPHVATAPPRQALPTAPGGHALCPMWPRTVSHVATTPTRSSQAPRSPMAPVMCTSLRFPR